MKQLDIGQQVAVRAWTQTSQPRHERRRSVGRQSSVQHILVFDTETTIDETQALLFGCYRYCRVDGLTVTTVAEGLIYADDLPQRDPAGYAMLRSYAASHKAYVDGTYLRVEPNWELQLLSRREFMNRWLWRVGYAHNDRRDPATVVTFNAPFDFSRIAVDVAEARDDMYGGFSLITWADPDGAPTSWRPRVLIKSLDSKRAFKRFSHLERGADDFDGYIVDLRTLVFALTGASHSLESACAAFGVEGKAQTPEFGVITEEAIDYCRQDVAATTRLYEAVMAEFATHPIDLPATAAYSPASIAKAYLRKIGIQPRLTTQLDFPPEILGYAMSAFYGGRAEVHLRHTPAPVTVVDFTSMYPTVDTLMGIWGLPIAACITGAARLMLALLEHTVEEAGGTWMFCDTDSMAIVATSDGGDLIPCQGGNYRLPDGTSAMKALSYQQVDEIRAHFNTLNPYDQDAIPDLLKLEHIGTCYAISAKRYVVYNEDEAGNIEILKRSEHGLGAYLDPLTPNQEHPDAKGNRIWIDEAWRWILAAYNNPDTPLPTWADRPALSRITISSTPLWRPFRLRNRGRSWAEQIKPFNFLMVATIDPFGYPPGVDPTKFRLIAAYNDDPDTWAGLEWRNIYDPHGPGYRITTNKTVAPAADLVIVKSYGDVLREYRLHPEYKFNDPDGQPCRRNTRGLLQRRPIHLDRPVRLIGKEANNIEEAQAGRYAQLDEIITEYHNPADDHLHIEVMPFLDYLSGRDLARLVGADRRTIDRVRVGHMPRRPLRQALERLANKLSEAE